MVKFDVVTFGSGVVDVFASTGVGEINVAECEKEEGGDQKCIKRLDLEIGGKYLIDGLRIDVGGGGTNTAVAFSRLGLKVGCVCGVGEDANGEVILDCLKKEKVDFLGKKIGVDGRGRKVSTGYSVIVDSVNNNRTILTYKGASNEIQSEEVKKFDSEWLYFSSLLGKSFEAQKKLAREFVGGGGKLAFNPSSYSIKSQDIRRILKLTTVLILNREEALSLCKRYGGVKVLLLGCEDVNQPIKFLSKLREFGPKVVVVTNKNEEIFAYDGEKLYSFMPHKRRKVVERTGAGDAFAAGFVAGMIKGYSINECLRLGNEESEAVLGHYGAKNNLVKRRLK